jgi:hypothetical protein
LEQIDEKQHLCCVIYAPKIDQHCAQQLPLIIGPPHKNRTSAHNSIPYAPGIFTVPTFAQKSASFVGKCTSTMEQMGIDFKLPNVWRITEEAGGT